MNSNKKEIIVYGLGRDFEDFRNTIEKKYHIIGYADSNIEKAGLYEPFMTIKEIRESKYDILISSIKYFNEIKKKLIEGGGR